MPRRDRRLLTRLIPDAPSRLRPVLDLARDRALQQHAAAISFQLLFALVPVVFVGVALLGFLSLEEVWRSDIAPDLRRNVSPSVFETLNDAVREVLDSKRVHWLTLGLLAAGWKTTSAAFAVMSAVNEAYGINEDRPWRRRILIGWRTAAATGGALALAFVVVRFGPSAISDVLGDSAVAEVLSFVVRWSVALALMLVALGLMLRWAPARRVPWRWAGRGALIVGGSWAAVSLIFGAYAFSIGSYGSLLGSLSVIFAALLYVYVSAVAFLVGVGVDAGARR